MKKKTTADRLRSKMDQDTKAILDRRQLLIRSALLAAGIGAGATLSGCRENGEAQVCLDLIDEVPGATAVRPAEPQECLDVAHVCLELAVKTNESHRPLPPKPQKSGQPIPQPCLSIIDVRSETKTPQPEPMPCLAPPLPRRAEGDQ